MPGTAVELIPGGLLDRLLATAGPDPLTGVRASVAAGAYTRALAQLDSVAGDPVTTGAWRRFAWHSCWLGLPDGGARPMADIGHRLLDLPPAPRAEVAVRAEDWIVGRLLPDLRDVRAISALALAGPSPAPDDDALPTGLPEIDEARQVVTAPDLLGHLDLLAADMAARRRRWDDCWDYWGSAVRRLSEAGDARGWAAAALAAGDLRAASLTSPVSWNCVLATILSAPGMELPDAVEEREFTADPADLAAAEAAYDDAQERYAELGDAAGLAAAALRRAYLRLVTGSPGEAVILATRARRAFEGVGRPLDAAVAAVHAALAAVADDVLPVDPAAAETIVAAGRETVGPGPAAGLAMLCARVGRFWAGRGARPERALAAFGVAERAFAGLDEPVRRSQSAAAAGLAAASVGDVPAVRVAVRDALAADSGPLAEPADPMDPRRQRRALLGARLHVLAGQIRDVEGMQRAGEAVHEALEPLRTGLDGFTGVARFIAEQLLTLAALPGERVVGLLYRSRAAHDAGDLEEEKALLAEARAELDTVPETDRDFDEALVLLYSGDHAGASAVFERHAQRELTGATAGSAPWRMIHVQSLAFQLNAGNPVLARAHHDALAQGPEPWWSGLGEAWEHRSLQARLHEQEGDLAAALAAFDRAITDIEAKRAGLRRDELKTSFFAGADVQNTYLDAARVALRLTREALAAGDEAAVTRWSAAAFGYAERARARALLDLMASNVDLEGAGLPSALVDRWRAAGARVTLAQDRLADGGGSRARLDEALAALRSVERELQEVNPRFWTLVNPQTEPSGLADVAGLLGDGVVLLQYATGSRDVLAWALTRDGMMCPNLLDGPDARRVAPLVAVTVDVYAAGRDEQPPADELADLLLEPLRPAIERATSLLVVPAGPLARLPFGTLPWNGAPLAAAFPITVMPSASTLALRRPAPGGAGRSLVVGNPSDMATGGERGDRPIPQPALPAAGVEAFRVATLLDDPVLLLGAEATADRVRAALPGAPVVHFATHGVLDPQSPLGAAVLLASGASLTAAELFGQRLDADLVVMSACHTGTGTVVRGDELLGLGRALLAAGARTVMVTLWAVDDMSAALLMTEFYRRRAAGVPDVLALQAAVNHLRTLSTGDARAAYEAMAAEAVAAGHPELGAVARRAARDVARPGREISYRHPKHWAPYIPISATCP